MLPSGEPEGSHVSSGEGSTWGASAGRVTSVCGLASLPFPAASLRRGGEHTQNSQWAIGQPPSSGVGTGCGSHPRLVWARDKGGLRASECRAAADPCSRIRASPRHRLSSGDLGGSGCQPGTRDPGRSSVPPASWAVWPCPPCSPAGLWEAAGRRARRAATGWPWDTTPGLSSPKIPVAAVPSLRCDYFTVKTRNGNRTRREEPGAALCFQVRERARHRHSLVRRSSPCRGRCSALEHEPQRGPQGPRQTEGNGNTNSVNIRLFLKSPRSSGSVKHLCPWSLEWENR